MWYLFMALGLYAVTPILRFHVARSGVALRWVVALGALAAASAWDLHLSVEGRPLPGIVPTMFVPYLGYYLLGYELRRLAPSSAHPALLWGTVAVGSLATIVGTHALVKTYGVTRLGLYMYEYLSPNVILTAIAIFCLASRVEATPAREGPVGVKLVHFVAWAAPFTLGVYLLHPMAIRGMQELGVSAVATGGVFGVLIVATPAFCASLLLVWGMSKIPLLRRGVGL
jgi:surface polysaccharide O-acyltransferase-like enzyme